MKNRIIIITAATSGVGKATAFELANPNNQLFLIRKNKQKGEELKKEILDNKPKANIELLYADLALQNDIRNLVIDFKMKHNKIRHAN